jgi:hypothetical protein
MGKRLLDRQVSLLAHLTSGDAIFGAPDISALGPAMEGVDPGLLRLEARFSFDKRIEKIAGVLPRTFELLGTGRGDILREFVAACPPVDISRIENARQFQAFLAERRPRKPRMLAYLPDVAACELACARARMHAIDHGAVSPPANAPHAEVRRKPGAILFRIAHDVRDVLEDRGSKADPVRRDTALASVVSRSGEVELLELAPEFFDLLVTIEDWIPLNAFASSGGHMLVHELAEAGLVEVRG